MAERIVIEPVTRIEGHARISLLLDEAGRVAEARFQVTQVRGFEQFVVGRPYFEMPALTARICGICPVSHVLASAKACDQLLAVRIPETAANLRRILNLGQLIQSHALSWFYLSAPDLLLGMDHPPATRNFLGIAATDRQFARDGIRLRRFGQQVIERLAGRRIHPAWVVPGGVDAPLEPSTREAILAEIPEIKTLACHHLERCRQLLDNHLEEARVFASFPSLFLGLTGPGGRLEHYDGLVRIIDADGALLADGLDPADYADTIGEAVEPWTYLKFPYYKPHGYPDGMYRVGPLARLNLVDRCGTELADRELAHFRSLAPGPVPGNFHAHYARLIELLAAVGFMETLLAIGHFSLAGCGPLAGVNETEVGTIKAPRGFLLHHLPGGRARPDRAGQLVIATGHNNLAMQRGILRPALPGPQPARRGAAQRLEAAIHLRSCLSLLHHAVGHHTADGAPARPGRQHRGELGH